MKKQVKKNRRRPIQFLMYLTRNEREYVSRSAFEKEDGDKRMSQGDFVISKVFTPGWEKQLERLRIKQRRVKSDLLWSKIEL